MTAESRKYSVVDYQACQTIWENRGTDMRTAIDETPVTGQLTVGHCRRLSHLNLLDGAEHGYADGDRVRLSGLGVKTAHESQRFGHGQLPNLPA